MNSVTNKEIKEFKKYVRDTLVKVYHMNEIEATHAVRNSYLSEALKILLHMIRLKNGPNLFMMK